MESKVKACPGEPGEAPYTLVSQSRPLALLLKNPKGRSRGMGGSQGEGLPFGAEAGKASFFLVKTMAKSFPLFWEKTGEGFAGGVTVEERPISQSTWKELVKAPLESLRTEIARITMRTRPSGTWGTAQVCWLIPLAIPKGMWDFPGASIHS